MSEATTRNPAAEPAEAPTPALRRALSWVRRNRHFVTAALVLAASAGGWSVAVGIMKIATQKYPVPWPAGVEVDEEFRMTSLPERLGPYEYVSGDTETEVDARTGRPVQVEIPGGEVQLSKDTMELLKIGTFTDGKLRPQRKSNWFAVRLYRDSRLPLRHPLRYWRLEVYYYTGGVDLVPHVPEICAVAGGAIHLRTEKMPVAVPAGAPPPWGDRQVEFHRALFERTNLGGGPATQFVQYYVFSLNGEPEISRNAVRLKLASPFVRHAYFAKIQFAPAPVLAICEPALADAAAREFAQHFLPAVLKTLPMPEDVARLDAGRP